MLASSLRMVSTNFVAALLVSSIGVPDILPDVSSTRTMSRSSEVTLTGSCACSSFVFVITAFAAAPMFNMGYLYEDPPPTP